MPYDSQGHFTRVHSWTSDYENGIEIVCDRHDEEDDNFAQGLNMALCRDGRAVMTGNLKLGSNKITGLANGETVNDAVNKGQLDAVQTALEESIAAIEIENYLGDIKASLQTANHGNWLLCNGQAVSRTTYADLYALIGTNFGEGDGATTFNVPNYQGKFLRGLGGDSAVDVYTTQAEGLPNITGNSGAIAGSLAAGGTGAGTGALNTAQSTAQYAATSNVVQSVEVTMDASKSNAIYGASNHVTPINQAVNWFIKAK